MSTDPQHELPSCDTHQLPIDAEICVGTAEVSIMVAAYVG